MIFLSFRTHQYPFCPPPRGKDIFMSNSNKFLQRLARGPVLCAEGYIFELERRGYVKAGAYVPEVVLDHPEVVDQLHREFVRAGSDVVVALTYYAHREKLRAIGREGDLEQLNRQALKIAAGVARESGTLLAGNICNTWAYDPKEPASKYEVRRQYTEQVNWAKQSGADFILAETIEYLGEALIALEVIKAAGLPAVINLSPIYGKSKDGFDWVEACVVLKANGADVVGFNCARGPATILPLVKRLRKAVDGPIAAVPVPFRTTKDTPSFQFLKDPESGKSSYTLGLDKHLCDREEIAAFAKVADKTGVAFIGICCGGAPHHVRAAAEALGRTTAASRFSPDLSEHSLLGDDNHVRGSEKQFLASWR
jgi:betaine-homocysteine S-methyltransferase